MLSFACAQSVFVQRRVKVHKLPDLHEIITQWSLISPELCAKDANSSAAIR